MPDYRPITVYFLGGSICGANWLSPPLNPAEHCRRLIDRLSEAGFEVHSMKISGKELPILADLESLEELLARNEPWEVLILMELTRMLQVAARLELEQPQFPNTVITLVGSPLLLGSPDELRGDPDGAMASRAISHATSGEIKQPGIYVADPYGCYPWLDVDLEVRLIYHPIA